MQTFLFSDCTCLRRNKLLQPYCHLSFYVKYKKYLKYFWSFNSIRVVRADHLRILPKPSKAPACTFFIHLNWISKTQNNRNLQWRMHMTKTTYLPSLKVLNSILLHAKNQLRRKFIDFDPGAKKKHWRLSSFNIVLTIRVGLLPMSALFEHGGYLRKNGISKEIIVNQLQTMYICKWMTRHPFTMRSWWHGLVLLLLTTLKLHNKCACFINAPSNAWALFVGNKEIKEIIHVSKCHAY